MFDTGSSKKQKNPFFLLFIAGVALICSFLMLEVVVFYRSMDFHRRLDAEGNLRFVVSRIKGHLEISRFALDLPPYLKSLEWLNDELREHPALYGVLIREENKKPVIVNTFPPEFIFREEDAGSCSDGTIRDAIYFLCRTIEVFPGETLFIVVAVDTTQQLKAFYRLIFLSCAAGGSIIVLFFFVWLHLKRLVEKEEKLKQRLNASEKLAVTGKLAAMIAHEIRNPLNTISMAVQYMRETGEVSQDMMEILNAETNKLKELSGELFGIHRDFSSGLEEFSVAEIIMELENKFSPRASSQGIAFFSDCSCESARIKGNKKWFLRALENMLRNAFEAVTPGEGKVVLRVKSEGINIVFSVEDNGCGITDSDRLMIFEPFYTTKNQGFGLGLYIVQKVAETHGGSVKVESSKDRGTIFIMTIPLGGVEFGGKKESKNSHCGR